MHVCISRKGGVGCNWTKNGQRLQKAKDYRRRMFRIPRHLWPRTETLDQVPLTMYLIR